MKWFIKAFLGVLFGMFMVSCVGGVDVEKPVVDEDACEVEVIIWNTTFDSVSVLVDGVRVHKVGAAGEDSVLTMGSYDLIIKECRDTIMVKGGSHLDIVGDGPLCKYRIMRSEQSSNFATSKTSNTCSFDVDKSSHYIIRVSYLY